MQMKKMGCSLDWSREPLLLINKERNLAVKTVFKKMYDDGLIYRGYKVVNWDPKGQTTISDDEIVYEERKATMYTFKYSKDFPIAISTTRPEKPKSVIQPSLLILKMKDTNNTWAKLLKSQILLVKNSPSKLSLIKKWILNLELVR